MGHDLPSILPLIQIEAGLVSHLDIDQEAVAAYVDGSVTLVSTPNAQGHW